MLATPLMLLAALLGSTQGARGSERLLIDSELSSAQFDISVILLFRLKGEFSDIEGHIDVDHDTGAIQVEATISAHSVRMNNPKHEAWLLSEEFFDAESYPFIYFSSMDLTLDDLVPDGELSGFLTVRNTTRPVSFRIQEMACDSPQQRYCPIRAEGSIQRRQFGMTSRRGTLSDRVSLDLTIAPLWPEQD